MAWFSIDTKKSRSHKLRDERFIGAENEIRTRDPHLGKVMLYH